MDEPPSSRRQVWIIRLKEVRALIRRALPFGAGMLATLAAIVLYNRLNPPPLPMTINQVDSAVADAMGSATPPPAVSAQVYQFIQPSLVLIQSERQGEDDESFFGLGSGVVITNAGDILTSLHVVAGASSIELIFADGTQSAGQIVATQPENDIAVVRALNPPALLVPAVLGNPNSMRVGDEVYAVGHPFGLYGSMSAGVISGFNRSFEMEEGGLRIEGLIQIDAAVNPGNSGGPLLNRDGLVIGIVTAILNPTEDDFFVGIGFAVPIDIAGSAAGLPPY